MNVVIEGADGSGKSTLAHYIASRTGMRVLESEGPPRYRGDIADRIRARSKMTNTIFVRHPVVSHPIYEAARRQQGQLSHELVHSPNEREFYDSSPTLIFCRSSSSHVKKPHDSVSHLQTIDDQQVLIRGLYRRWAIAHAHVIHTMGDDPDRIVSYLRPFDPVGDVQQFHEKNALDYTGKPRALPFDLTQFRLKFKRQEVGEYEQHADSAMNELDKLTGPPSLAVGELAFNESLFIGELAQSLDALVDLVYVTLGTAHLQGFDFRRAWKRVHVANMSKVRVEGAARTAEERMKLKMVKPPGWVPPDHRDLVCDHAHSTEHQP